MLGMLVTIKYIIMSFSKHEQHQSNMMFSSKSHATLIQNLINMWSIIWQSSLMQKIINSVSSLLCMEHPICMYILARANHIQKSYMISSSKAAVISILDCIKDILYGFLSGSYFHLKYRIKKVNASSSIFRCCQRYYDWCEDRKIQEGCVLTLR